jgi:hypothetical protein
VTCALVHFNFICHSTSYTSYLNRRDKVRFSLFSFPFS